MTLIEFKELVLEAEKNGEIDEWTCFIYWQR